MRRKQKKEREEKRLADTESRACARNADEAKDMKRNRKGTAEE